MTVIILGATARAAAFSAQRAGMRPWCADLFADADLARAFPVRRVSLAEFPVALINVLAGAPDGPVLYTGGVENRPDLVERIDRPLWGNRADVLRRVRSPFLLADTLRQAGLPVLDVRCDGPPVGDGRAWLVKPLRSGGGVGIRPFMGQAFDLQTHYLQAYCPGLCFGAMFLGMADGSSLLLGMTHQFEAGSFGAPEFHYCGGMGPVVPVPMGVRRLGEILVRGFSLRGLFGVDFIYRVDPETGHDACFLLEVNPRYTASVEVLERAFDTGLLDLHRAVFEGRPIAWTPPPQAPVVWGKAILYARKDVVFPADGPWMQSLRQSLGDGDAEYADIPHAGEHIPRGRPVLTVFASGSSARECLLGVRERLQALDCCLFG
jgi:uncharacterized protein